MGRSCQDQLACQKAMDLVTDVHQLSGGFPKEKLYRLTSQLLRAAVSLFQATLRKVRAVTEPQSSGAFYGLQCAS